jgi:hypothetical protein
VREIQIERTAKGYVCMFPFLSLDAGTILIEYTNDINPVAKGLDELTRLGNSTYLLESDKDISRIMLVEVDAIMTITADGRPT